MRSQNTEKENWKSLILYRYLGLLLSLITEYELFPRVQTLDMTPLCRHLCNSY